MRLFTIIAVIMLAVFTASLISGFSGMPDVPDNAGDSERDLRIAQIRMQQPTADSRSIEAVSTAPGLSAAPSPMPTPAPTPMPELKLTSVQPLPIDFTPGMKPDPRGYLSETEYFDPSIHVKIRKDRKNECDVWIADIEIADASQLRTAAADGFESNMVMSGQRMADRMNAVLAIEGDYYCYTGKGLIIRQGRRYLDRLKNRDVLLIDEDGDFIGLEDPPAGSIGDEINGKKIINAFFFGPLLVNNGKVRVGGFANGMMYQDRCQRMALAQTGHLKYRVIACGPSVRGSTGMTVDEFRSYIAAMPDVKVAYNMDGGDSTMILFNGKKVNDPDNPDTREVADIVYFASAYTGEARNDAV